MSDQHAPKDLYRWGIPCTYHGDEAFRGEVIAFVCGMIAGALGVATNYMTHGLDSADFDVFLIYPSAELPTECAERWQTLASEVVPIVAEFGATVKIGGPMLIGDSITMRFAVERAGQAEA